VVIEVLKGKITDIQVIETKHDGDYSGVYSILNAKLKILTTDNSCVECQYEDSVNTMDKSNALCESIKNNWLKKFSIADEIIIVGKYQKNDFIFDAFINKTKNIGSRPQKKSILQYFALYVFLLSFTTTYYKVISIGITVIFLFVICSNIILNKETDLINNLLDSNK
jgi:hypothetical protein